MTAIPSHRPTRAPNELAYLTHALASEKRQGGGDFTKRCQSHLRGLLDAPGVLLTQSCTAALEFAGALLDIGPGDEVIVPSYTFTSTATAFAIRGARLAFVDVDPRTQNIDPQWIAGAITPATRAIVPVHYAGVSADMAAIRAAIAHRPDIAIIEDAAQAIGAETPDGRPLGALGDLAAFSFHDTKNISSGEGGALAILRSDLVGRAEILWEKGTNRSAFLKGEVDKYTWVDIGSSFLPSEITAAMLLAQLEVLHEVNAKRLAIWDRYHAGLADLEARGALVRPVIPTGARHNAHLYYVILDSLETRDRLMAHLKSRAIAGVFHYVPLHDSLAGKKYGRVASPMTNSVRAGTQLLRLPLFTDMTRDETDRVLEAVHDFFGQ